MTSEFVSFRSLQRALDRRLYLLLYGKAYGSSGEPVWHFPEKVYEAEDTLRKVNITLWSVFYSCYFSSSPHLNSKTLQCAESALHFVLGDLSHTYFVGNAPMGHMIIQPTDKAPDAGYKVFSRNYIYNFLLGKYEMEYMLCGV